MHCSLLSDRRPSFCFSVTTTISPQRNSLYRAAGTDLAVLIAELPAGRNCRIVELAKCRIGTGFKLCREISLKDLLVRKMSLSLRPLSKKGKAVKFF
jgi:hypothetical protein